MTDSARFSHDAYLGNTVDHLYTNCPSLLRSARARVLYTGQDCPHCGGQVPVRAIGKVDPLGTDLCGLCVRRWVTKTEREQGVEIAWPRR